MYIHIFTTFYIYTLHSTSKVSHGVFFLTQTQYICVYVYVYIYSMHIFPFQNTFLVLMNMAFLTMRLPFSDKTQMVFTATFQIITMRYMCVCIYIIYNTMHMSKLFVAFDYYHQVVGLIG